MTICPCAASKPCNSGKITCTSQGTGRSHAAVCCTDMSSIALSHCIAWLLSEPHTTARCVLMTGFPDFPVSPKETLPYGTFYVQSLVQPFDPAFEAAAATVANNILFCVLDDGVLATHPDLAGNNLKGAGACYNETDAAGKPTAVQRCVRWDDPKLSYHGTHVIGTIAALQNGQGVIGVSATKSNVFSYNVFPFGKRNGTYDDLILGGIAECTKELETLQQSNPAMKMVVSMSLGGPRLVAPVLFTPAGMVNATIQHNRQAVNETTTHYNGYFATFEKPYAQLYKRGDILFVAAAG